MGKTPTFFSPEITVKSYAKLSLRTDTRHRIYVALTSVFSLWKPFVWQFSNQDKNQAESGRATGKKSYETNNSEMKKTSKKKKIRTAEKGKAIRKCVHFILPAKHCCDNLF
jgi:hypothetical protein